VRAVAAVAGHTFANTLHGADLGAVLHGVDGEVNLGEGLLLLDRADGIVDLHVLGAALVGGGHDAVLGIHGGGGFWLRRLGVWERERE